MTQRTVRERLFHAWFRARRSMTLGVRVAAFDPDDRVGLVRHTYTPGWHLPGGGVEPREQAHEAAERELIEETGVSPASTLTLVGVHAHHEVFPNDHVLIFRCRVLTPPVFTPNREIAEVVWARPEALPQEVTAVNRWRIDQALAWPAVVGPGGERTHTYGAD